MKSDYQEGKDVVTNIKEGFANAYDKTKEFLTGAKDGAKETLAIKTHNTLLDVNVSVKDKQALLQDGIQKRIDKEAQRDAKKREKFLKEAEEKIAKIHKKSQKKIDRARRIAESYNQGYRDGLKAAGVQVDVNANVTAK